MGNKISKLLIFVSLICNTGPTRQNTIASHTRHRLLRIRQCAFALWREHFARQRLRTLRDECREQSAALFHTHRIGRQTTSRCFHAWQRLSASISAQSRSLAFSQSILKRRSLRAAWDGWRSALVSTVAARRDAQRVQAVSAVQFGTGRMLLARCVRRLLFARVCGRRNGECTHKISFLSPPGFRPFQVLDFFFHDCPQTSARFI